MNLTRKFLVIILLIVTSVLNSCKITNKKLSMSLKNELLKKGALNYISLHKNPKIGDYSITKYFDKYKKIEIINISNESIHLKISSQIKIPNFVSIIEISAKNYFFEYYIDKEGTTQDAYIVDPETNIKEGLEKRDILYQKKKIFEKPEFIIKTKINTFKTRLVCYLEKVEDEDLYHVEFLSDDVNFLLVRKFILNKFEYNHFISLSDINKVNFNLEKKEEIVEQGNQNFK